MFLLLSSLCYSKRPTRSQALALYATGGTASRLHPSVESLVAFVYAETAAALRNAISSSVRLQILFITLFLRLAPSSASTNTLWMI